MSFNSPQGWFTAAVGTVVGMAVMLKTTDIRKKVVYLYLLNIMRFVRQVFEC